MDSVDLHNFLVDLRFEIDRFVDRLHTECPPSRDELAARAMQGLLAAPHLETFEWASFAYLKPADLAQQAYAIADAMVAARAVVPKPEAG